MIINTSVSPGQVAAKIRMAISQEGYAIAKVSDRETYMVVCRELGDVTQTRDIMVSPDKAEPYTGYSYKPEDVPFHTDYPLINIVGLYCVTPDKVGGENLLIDSRCVLKELKSEEIACLWKVYVPLPRSKEVHPVLSMTRDQLPHIYWLPAFVLPMLSELDSSRAEAVTRFNEILLQHRKDRNYNTIRLAAGEALWFNNYVMLHGRDRLDMSSLRHQVRAFISTHSD